MDFASTVKGTDSSVLMPLTDLDPENQQHRIYWDNILNGLGDHIPKQEKGNAKRSTTFCLYGQFVDTRDVALGPLEYKIWDKEMALGDDVPFQGGQILDDYVKEEMTAWIAKIKGGVSKACHSGFKNLNKNIKTHRYNTFGYGIHWNDKGTEVDRTLTAKWWERKAKGDGKGSKSVGNGEGGDQFSKMTKSQLLEWCRAQAPVEAPVVVPAVELVLNLDNPDMANEIANLKKQIAKLEKKMERKETQCKALIKARQEYYNESE
jgi:hypothetical protein